MRLLWVELTDFRNHPKTRVDDVPDGLVAVVGANGEGKTNLIEGIAFLYPRAAAVLADEMGLGKTMQAITAMRLLLHARQVRNILLICPKPLVSNWEREFLRLAPEVCFRWRPSRSRWLAEEARAARTSSSTAPAPSSHSAKRWPRNSRKLAMRRG